jgi:hypothetical protein
MSRNILQTGNVNNDILQMSEAIKPTGERTVHIDLINGNTKKKSEAVMFSTDTFDIYNPRASTAEGTIFKSLEVYYSIHPVDSNKNYTPSSNQLVDNAFQFLSKLELYHLQVGDIPWLDATLYFKPWFSVSSSSISKLNLPDLNDGRTRLVIEISLMDGELKFYTEATDGSNKTILLSTGRYELKIDQIYSALQKYARITATPKSISNTIINNL